MGPTAVRVVPTSKYLSSCQRGEITLESLKSDAVLKVIQLITDMEISKFILTLISPETPKRVQIG